jgi:hypothetical protein
MSPTVLEDNWRLTAQEVSPHNAPPSSWFWRSYWLVAAIIGLTSVLGVFLKMPPDINGICILLFFLLLFVGLVPWAVMSVERAIGWALLQRDPNYQHRWSTAALWRWWLHWAMVVACVVLLLAGASLPRGRGQTACFVIAGMFIYPTLVLICLTLGWRSKRMRLGHYAKQPELRGFELLQNSDPYIREAAEVFPMFAGQTNSRCPAILHRELGNWNILLFDWLDKCQSPPRREWISLCLVKLHQPLPHLSLQALSRFKQDHLPWWMLLEFPIGWAMFMISILRQAANRRNRKEPLTVSHTPALTLGYQLDCRHWKQVEPQLVPELCNQLIQRIHLKKRFLITSDHWLLLAVTREVPVDQLGELAADAIRLADLLEASLSLAYQPVEDIQQT